MLKRIASLLIASVLALSLLAGLGVSAEAPQADLVCKNVILLIASGVSPAHITAAAIKTGKHLNLQDMPYSGALDTTNADNAISDPAAAATALATGVRTANFALGVDRDGNPLDLITHAMQNAGKKVGIITDKYINDATPAAFAVHNPLKSDLYGVARQEIASGIDLFLGGGSKYFDGYRADIKAAGYDYVTTPARLGELTGEKKTIGAFSNYTFATGYNVPSLSEMLTKATEILDNENGFFIVAEGGLIEKYSFERDINKMAAELVKFDEAVGAAKTYVDEHPDTLLVIAGDVEAGQLTLNERPTQGNTTNACFKKYGTSNLNTALFTYGKNASAFTGEHKSSDVPKFIAASVGIEGFAADYKPMSFAEDYIVDELNSFSSWTFTNVKKNSNVSGVKLNTTSSNNSAVTAMCSKGSLVIMSNAKVGYDITVTAPLAIPFKLKNGGSADLSAYAGFVLTAAGFADNTFELTVAKGDSFSATVTVTEDMKNEYGEILLPFSAFDPVITPENAVGLDTFKFATDGCSAKATVKLDSIHAYTIDEGLNYYDALGVASGKDSLEYTADSFAAFSAAFDAFKAAVTRAERYAAKLELLEKIDALVPVAKNAEDIGLIEANAGSVTVSSSAVSLSDGVLDVFCGSANASVAFENIPERSGSFEAVRVRLSTLYPDLTAGDFAVRLTVTTASGDVSALVERALIKNGDYCFALPLNASEITNVKVEFVNAKIGAVVRIEGIDLISDASAKAIMKTAKLPDALAILRAAAGLATVENGDLNGDGRVDIADALIALRAEVGLA